jgi:hypothetical protein
MTEIVTRPSGKWEVGYDSCYVGWEGTHEDFDGAPSYSDGPCLDKRCFYGRTREEVIEQIDEYEEEHADA